MGRGCAFMCEAVPCVDVVVRRASPPRIIPTRASWSRALPPPPARVVVHLASLALLISFWLPLASATRGRGATHGGTTRRGKRRRVRGCGARRTKTSAGKTARGRATQGTVSHTNAPPRRLSRLIDCPLFPTFLRARCPATMETDRSGEYRFRPTPPYIAHTKNRRSENVEITIR